jgi:AraC-like DNA-binding protein
VKKIKKYAARKGFNLNDEQTERYLTTIKSFLKKETPWRQRKYSLEKMSADCGIPRHHLSMVINQAYCLSFTQLMNNCRILFIIDNRRNKEWVQFTMEAIALESGFNSRSAFNKAFKQMTGKAVRDYFLKKA